MPFMMDTSDLGDVAMADVQIQTSAMLDSMDDLFGEPSNLGVVQAPLLTGPPPSSELVRRIAEMQRSGACTKLAWSTTGSIARISPDGARISFHVMEEDDVTREPRISETSSYPINADPGTRFVHLDFTAVGHELAVVDSVGHVRLFVAGTGLGRMSAATSETRSNRGDLDAVVGLYWLPCWPMDFRIPYVGPTTKIDGTWISKLHYRDQHAPRLHHPVDGRNALLHVTRKTALTLEYQSGSSHWASTSVTLEPVSTLDETLSHAAFCQQDDKILLVTHDLRRHLRVYTISVDWNATQGTDRPGVISVAPALQIAHTVSLEYITAQHSEGALLTSLHILPPLPIFAEPSLPSYTTILAVYTQAVYPPDPTQQSESFTAIARWHLEELAQTLHPSFAKLRKQAAAPAVALPNKKVLRRQPDLATVKSILTVQPLNRDTLIAFGASDGTVEYRDRETWHVSAAPFDASTTMENLPQAGFDFSLSPEQCIHLACNTSCAVMAVVSADNKLRCKSAALRYGWQAIDENIMGVSDVHESAIAAVAREHTLLTHYNSASVLELFALLPRGDPPPAFRLDFLHLITRALTRAHDLFSFDEKTKQRMLLGDHYIVRCLGAQMSLLPSPRAHPGLGAQLAWLTVNAKHAHFALFSSCSSNTKPDPATLHSLRGLAVWSLDLFTATLASLFEVHSALSKSSESTTAALRTYLASSTSPFVHLALCSYPRTLLRYLAFALTRYFKCVASSLPTSPSLSIKTDLLETIAKIKTLPFRLEILAAPNGLLGEIEKVVSEAYTTANVAPKERAEVELSMLVSPAPELPPAVEAAAENIWSTILPKYLGEMDLGTLYFSNAAGLALQSRAMTGSGVERRLDVLTKLPIGIEAKVRTCRRCGSVMEDFVTTAEGLREIAVGWRRSAHGMCVCGGSWWVG